MTKIIPPARCAVATLAALASLALLAAPIQRALADKPATPVIVVNPQPVTVDNPATSDPGRAAYQSEVNQFCGGEFLCTVSFPVVPPGHRLVIQHVSGYLSFSTPPNAVVVYFVSPAMGGRISFYSFFAPFVGGLSVFDQAVLRYVDAGDAPSLNIVADGALFGGGGEGVILTGYLLDCTAAPCAPIAH